MEEGKQYSSMYTVRKTQRAPRSCKECTRRKIRCDKTIPCQQCFDRGQAATCDRERVKVKNKLVKGGLEAPPAEPFFHSIEQEVAWLRRKCSLLQEENHKLSTGLELQKETETYSDSAAQFNKDDDCDSEDGVQKFAPALRHLTLGLVEDDQEEGLSPPQNRDLLSDTQSIRHSPPNIPALGAPPHTSTLLLSRLTRQQSQYLVSFNFSHISWIHCALHGPSFLSEHQTFRDQLENGTYEEDHLWNALLLAVLSTSLFYLDRDVAVETLNWPEDDIDSAPQVLFEASLKSLDAAEYMRFPRIRSVQTFCVLTLCFPVFGSFHYQYTLLNAMIYISQSLNLHVLGSEVPTEEAQLVDEKFIDREVGRRLYWTIVIIDWLSSNSRVSAIASNTFDTAFPGNFNDADLSISSLRTPRLPSETTCTSYHVALAKASSYKKTLYSHSVNGRPTIAKLKEAEESLDRIIAELPSGLSNKPEFEAQNQGSDIVTWFQRYMLTLHLRLERLYIRLSPYKGELDKKWNSDSRTICLQLAHETVRDLQLPIPALFTKNWSIVGDAVYVGLFYLLDLKENETSPDTATHILAVESIVAFLMPLIKYHIIAERGVKLLQRLLSPPDSPESVMPQQNGYPNSTIDLRRLEQRLRVHPRGLAKVSETPTQHTNMIGSWPGVEIEDGVWDPLWQGMNDASGQIYVDEAWLAGVNGYYMS